jgi:PAS domain S-box-containing protein
MNAADQLWLQAPCAALKLADRASLTPWQLNAAAIDWSLDAGVTHADWCAAMDRLAATAVLSSDGQVRVGSRALNYRVIDLADGRLLWLTPLPASTPHHDGAWHDAAEKLELMQGFNRMGFFELDVRSGQSRWDKHMFRLLGLEPTLRSPDFVRAVSRVHPEDRASVVAHRQHSMQQAGRHQQRFRLLLPDGTQRDIHSLSEVRTGADGLPATVLGVLIDDSDSAARVRAQEAISAKLSEALELAMISVWRIDLQARRIHMNDQGFGFNGLAPRAEGLGLDEIRALVHPDDLPAVVRAAEQAIAGTGVVDVEARYLHSDGSYRYLLTRRVAERDAQGRVVALTGVSLDQTAQIAERERAQALARRIQLVADATGVGVWTIENPGEGDAERVEWNAQMFRIYGLPEDAPAPPVRDWMGARVHAQDRRRVAEERRRARKSGKPGFETSFRVVRPDGSLRWVVCRSHRDEREGRSVLHGIHLDVTRQRALDETLRLQEQRLQLATQIAGVGIWDRDLASEQVIWEEQMYRLRGLQPDDPRSPREIDERIMLPQALAERRQRIQRHLRDGEAYEYEFEVRWPDGSVHWLASTGRALRDEQGAALRMVGLNWDVTQRRRADAALRDMEAAERASRAKSEFLARMSHELRTPLNAMLGFAQLLQHDGAERLDAQQRGRIERIRSAGAHLLSLIEDVLDLAAVEAGALPVELQPTPLDAVVDEVRQWVAPLAAERALTLHVQSSGASVHADRRHLRQVLSNLMTNAIKYNRQGGQVWVAAQRLAADGGDGVLGWALSVRDNGRGLSVEQQSHLFEPFNRLGAERDGIEGRGIGLATAQHLVRRMGGQLQVQSRLGEGSEFVVWLPESEAAGIAGNADADMRALAAAVPLSLLYVEDNAVNALVVQELVALRPNVVLRVAADGASGVALALRDRPDLVLVDMQLPDIDGFEVLRRLREQGSPARLVALSANAMPDAVARARAQGFDDYWTKPIDFKQFLDGLDRLADACAMRMRCDTSSITAKE